MTENLDLHFLLAGIAVAVFIALVVVVNKRIMAGWKRKEGDKKPVASHKMSIKSPTWRFQKYHPHLCTHKNGIHRKVKYNILGETIKKSIFVCADCVSVIEIDELEEIDKFKQ